MGRGRTARACGGDRHVSYRQLAEVLEDLDGQDYVGTTLRLWRDLLLAVDRITDLVGRPQPEDSFVLTPQLRAILRGVRLDGPLQKLRAHHVALLLKRSLVNVDVSVGANLTNATGLVEAFVEVADDIEAGWQLQGRHWRMAVRVKNDHPSHGRGDDKIADRAKIAARSGWATFDLPVLRKPPFAGLTPRPTTADGTPTFGRFSPDFAYRYVKLDDITVREVVDVGADIIRLAAESRGDDRWLRPSDQQSR